MFRPTLSVAASIALLLSACSGMTPMSSTGAPAASSSGMSFFITSSGSGKGGDYGGLAGADRHCQTLAGAAGAGGKTWHAYLSTQGAGAVNARDRIGAGPWRNAKGEVVATSVADLHSANNKLGKQTSLTEKGDVVNGRGDSPNRHDILTGSRPDGTAFPGTDDMTCGNWTKSVDGSAMVGHHDRNGTNPDPVANVSWNSSHKTSGCSDAQLASTGSAGYLYCFATN
jgi:hypothetical protein